MHRFQLVFNSGLYRFLRALIAMIIFASKAENGRI